MQTLLDKAATQTGQPAAPDAGKPAAPPPDKGASPPAAGTPPADGSAKPGADSQGVGTPPPAAEKPPDSKVTVPDRYEFKLPEGHELDSKVLEAYSGVAKKHSQSQEQAQEVLDTLLPALADAGQRQFEARVKEWEDQAVAAEDIGGNKLDLVVRAGAAVLAQYGSPELKALLGEQGFGSNQHVLRFLNKVARDVLPDAAFVENTVPTAPLTEETTRRRTMYPTMATQKK